MKPVTTVPITRVTAGGSEAVDDDVAVEEPLEIRLAEKPLAVTMRTPGHDFDLATGFLLTEGIIREAAEIDSMRHWGSPNVVRVALRAGLSVDLQKLQRHFYSTSSCGVCGKGSIDAIRVHADRLPAPANLEVADVLKLAESLRREQQGFEQTGALHGAAVFDHSGRLLAIREDVGRHNAVDKVIGALAGERRPLGDAILVVSGRTSFEIVQKAVVARIPVIAGVGAPSSLAIETAREFGATLLGFLRDGRYNVY